MSGSVRAAYRLGQRRGDPLLPIPPRGRQQGGGTGATPHTSPPLKRRFLKKFGGATYRFSIKKEMERDRVLEMAAGLIDQLDRGAVTKAEVEEAKQAIDAQVFEVSRRGGF